MTVGEIDLFTGKDKREMAIDRIREFCKGKKVLVAFSGGKDSQTVYHLAKEAGIKFDAQYSITRFEPPELMRFIQQEYPQVTFRRAYNRSLVEDIRLHGLPNRWYRWCCQAKHCATPGYDIVLIGVRAAESARRAKSWRMFGKKQNGENYLCPIIDWTESDVWDYLNGNGIPHCKLYDEGYHRIGCVLCPLTRSSKDAERWPKTAAMIKLGWRLFVERMRASGFRTATGAQCGDWSRQPVPEEAGFDWWVKSQQTQKDPSEILKTPDYERQGCLFEGTGFSEKDGEMKTEEE